MDDVTKTSLVPRPEESAARGRVVAVSRSATHQVSKEKVDAIRLIGGLGVEGDAHAGRRVRHRSRVAANPEQPNLRQVHLIHAELHEELAAEGFEVESGAMGENVTTKGVDLLGLARGTRLVLAEAVVEITGLRNPCAQLDGLVPGLMARTAYRGREGRLVRRAGVMGIVIRGGVVRAGDSIAVEPPAGKWVGLEPV